MLKNNSMMVSNVAINNDKSANNESCDEIAYMSQGAASRMLRMESYDSGSSAFNNRTSLPILQQ